MDSISLLHISRAKENINNHFPVFIICDNKAFRLIWHLLYLGWISDKQALPSSRGIIKMTLRYLVHLDATFFINNWHIGRILVSLTISIIYCNIFLWNMVVWKGRIIFSAISYFDVYVYTLITFVSILH